MRATILFLLLILGSVSGLAQSGVRTASYKASVDNSFQRTLFYAPPGTNAVPLLVALHTWSGDYKQRAHNDCETWCVEKGWAFLHPDFRGPNRRPEACGSFLATEDVLDAITFAKRNARIDTNRIYLVGTSGGGHMALLLAGKHPEIWAGVSAWVPISDLAAWHAECDAKGSRYAKDLEACCGGRPGDSDKVDAEYRRRSPLTHLAAARGKVNLDINAGIQDGHKGSVPISHSLRAFNLLAEAKDQVSEEHIQYMLTKRMAPLPLKFVGQDLDYKLKLPRMRITSGKARVTIFEGGHEYISGAALKWLDGKRR